MSLPLGWMHVLLLLLRYGGVLFLVGGGVWGVGLGGMWVCFGGDVGVFYEGCGVFFGGSCGMDTLLPSPQTPTQRVVRNIVNGGRTVTCTIHQPSTEIFECFDQLLMMKRGGWVVYFGDIGRHSASLIRHFESFPEVPKFQVCSWLVVCVCVCVFVCVCDGLVV